MGVLATRSRRFEYRTAEINGVTYNYIFAEPKCREVVGTIFLIHGWPDMSLGWRNQIPYLLSKGLRVIAPDMMGYGGTDAPEDVNFYTFKRASDDIAALASHLGLSRIILGGHDWGGAVVYRAALWHPELVSAFFVISTPFAAPRITYVDQATALPTLHYQLQFRTDAIQNYIGPGNAQNATRVRQILNTIYGQTLPNGASPFNSSGSGLDLERLDGVTEDTPLLSTAELDYYVENYVSDPFNRTLNWYRTGELNWKDELALVPGNASYTAKYSQPALYIGGSLDSALPPVLSTGMETYFDSLSRGEVNGTHWVMWEKPEDVNSYVGRGYGNNSNVFRVYASIKRGQFKDDQGNKVEQVAEYFPGIGTDKLPLNKYNDGITGSGCYEQVQEVFSYCCEQITSKDDEVWFFGFSRGAYVCRVVSVLLNRYTLKEPLDTKDRSKWKTITSMMGKRKKAVINGREYRLGNGHEFRFALENTRHPPKIKFMGLFDTVKAVMPVLNKDIADISDLGFIEQIRHALALNEERMTFPLLHIEPTENGAKQHHCLEAWFVGAHNDMGGGAVHDGLSLYPLQWMLIESRDQGLVLEHNPPDHLKGIIENPLELVFPEPPKLSDLDAKVLEAEVPDEILKPQPWTFRYSNGADITMYDLRQSHQHGNLQEVPRRKLKKRNLDQVAIATHVIEINPGFHGLAFGGRRVFDAKLRGSLRGYSTDSRNGIVIHPSVYFLVDCYPTLGIPKALGNLMGNLESFRDRYNYLSDRLEAKLESFDPWRRDFMLSTSCRILICGNTGVGKSTLLNRVFGIEMTQENSDQRGKHDIDEGFESDQHPGIIIHDSEGFQTGNSKEVSAFKKFLKARSGNKLVRENLHAIWLCIDTDTDRPVQSALANVLEEVIEIAPLTPVVIVGTKKDKYLRLNEDEQSEAELLAQREATFRKRFEVEPDTTRFWPELRAKFTFVSRDDSESIKALIHMTRSSFLDPEVSEAMCAAQVPDVDAKVDQAVEKTLRFLRATSAAAGAGFGTGLVSTATTPTIARILCTEIAHGCFGIPKANIENINMMLARIVWKNLAPFMAQALSQTLIIWGGALCLTCTTVVGGIPLALGAPLLEAPTAVRMVLKCACDLILILDQAFREGGKSISRERIERVALTYMKSKIRIQKDGVEVELSRKKVVHARIDEMVPWISKHAYEAHSRKSLPKYREGIKDILNKYTFGYGKAADAEVEVELDDDVTVGVNSIEALSLDLSEDEEDMKEFNGEVKYMDDKL
ncbi:hypothetical protein CkaCkLH20_12587 [Colletotrichum karsti]|uniref:AB hydrolase-1 domain-containing protein n=1 Tax=Colletotrichum karsti TaxID=1095194 RepID=A0A9P6HSH6_9PEZI|nr:uncharacterized protein CkaCkLH20_12587 [Colletotrichum karsti]KAF9869978.1 hypothetical protein CkaCkLH20_12587 [Colletotrichum karsti]